MYLSAKMCATGLAAAACLIFLPSAAFAGECPAGKTGQDVTPPGPSEPKNVTDMVISSIDLGAGYNIPGRQLRMRRLEIKPGGVVPWHGHEARPANIYIMSGSVTEYRSNCAVPIEHKKGDVVAESGAVSHWWRNNSRRTTVLLSADILPPDMSADASM
ncbi:MAG: cupin domain-containing protein [Alphaproteobacteria bacterium]|nr:cupin domain-containing protein [Alphaproteobacteria bacterium]